jgi:hypothetical protein
MPVACKVAVRQSQRQMLMEEYEIYMHLAKKRALQGIPTVLGFFTDMEEGGPNILVMTYAGKALHSWRSTRLKDSQLCVFSFTNIDI